MKLVVTALLVTLSAGAQPLLDAVQANEEDKVAALLASGANPNAANSYGITPLWMAATNGSTAVTRMLLKAGGDAKAKLPHGETALMAASRTGRPEPIQLLLAAGADPNAQETSQGESALMWAAAENHPEAIRTLIAGGANPDLHAKALDLAPMKWMNVGMVDTILPRGGFTALLYAARQDAKDAVRALADSGASLETQDADGTTALHYAIMNQHYDLAALLLEKGANPNTADNSGMTAHYAAVEMNTFRSDIGRPPRLLQDQLTALDVLKLALQHGGNPNARLRKATIGRHHGFSDNSIGDGGTALMRAIKNNDFDAARVLLDAGADAGLGMTNGSNPLLLLAAVRVTPPQEAAILGILRSLAQHGANVNAANPRGETPLLAAARAGSNAMVRALAELGANLDAKDATGKTAVEIVSEPGRSRREDTAALLRELAAARQ